MSNHSIAVWILSSLSGILVLFVGVATGLNDPAHATHEMGQLFGYIGFAVLIVSSFFAMWAIYIYEPEKIRIDQDELNSEVQFQVTHDNENFPMFGLDMFDDAQDAFDFADELESEGRENVVVTLFVGGAAIRHFY
jgi:hypothetical protein